MARPWRLRHKLTLLLGLVLAAVGLLLAGTVFGLTAYRATVDATDGKLDELQIIARLKEDIHRAAGDPAAQLGADEPPLDFERRQAAVAVAAARVTLGQYQEVLAVHTARRGGGEVGRDEATFVSDIAAGLDDLERAVDRAAAGGSMTGSADVRLIGPKTPAGQVHARLKLLADNLHGYLIEDMKRAADMARAAHTRSLTVAGSAAAGALVFLLTLLHYFRVWVFAPIRRLQAGVRRVRAGEFDQPIGLTSQDEFAEVADEFDAMTVRVQAERTSLRQQVNERTKQLVRSEKMVSVGFLAAGVAHEINNPLASIAFCSEALESRLTELLGRAPASESEVVLKYLRMVQDEAQRCKQITQKLLDFSRSGGRREPADLAQLVRDVIEVAECLPNARDRRIVFTPTDVVVVAVSVPDVKGVVLNMVVNALDSMDAGGVLTIRLNGRGECAELAFTDTGCGMTADTLDNIFEPFFTRSKTGQGTGLGLSISHQIIDQHGGAVTAASPGPGRGSTFTVRLPLTDTTAPATLPFPAGRVAA